MAQAHVDQLTRSQMLDADTAAALTDALERADERLKKWRKRDEKLADELTSLGTALMDKGDLPHGEHLASLLDQIGTRLR